MIAMLETGGGMSSETGWCARTYLEIEPHTDDSYRVLIEYKFGWIRWLFSRRDYAVIYVEPEIWKWIFRNGMVPAKSVEIHKRKRKKSAIRRGFFKPVDPIDDRL